MSSPPAPNPRLSAGVRRPSLSAMVLRLTAVALVAAVLVWSVLYLDLVRKRGERSAALTQHSGQLSSSDSGQATEAPAPVTTHSS